MDVLQQGTITLLRSAVTGEKLPLPDGLSLEEVCRLAGKHHMPTLIYAGMVNCGVDRAHPVMRQLFQRYCKALMISERQMQMLKRLYEAFERERIDYMPLKGSMMKALYPAPELRMMGDADILIRDEQYPRIAQLMQKLGLEGGEKEDHHYVWKNDSLCLELHKFLIAQKYPELHAFFGTGWDLAAVTSGTRHAMSAADTFVFIFAHFSKHFANSGIGCRHIVDLWVYLSAHPVMDEAYVMARLNQIQLKTFYLNIRRLLSVWFENGEPDELMESMTAYIMSNGSWGTKSNAVVANEMRSNGERTSADHVRMKAVLRWIYPGRTVLCREYPVLNKMPALLPVIAGVRMVRKVFSKEARRRKAEAFVLLRPENIDNKRSKLASFGLEDTM